MHKVLAQCFTVFDVTHKLNFGSLLYVPLLKQKDLL